MKPLIYKGYSVFISEALIRRIRALFFLFDDLYQKTQNKCLKCPYIKAYFS